MGELFLRTVNSSIAASWLILAVMVLRLLLKRAPKWFHVLLWGLAAVRLICPLTLESPFSLIPSGETVPLDIGMSPAPSIQSGIPVLNEAVNPIIRHSALQLPGAGTNPLQLWITIGGALWLFGMAVVLLCACVSYISLRRKVGPSLYLRERIWICDDIQTPFILGCFRPRIYIPSGTEEKHLPSIIAHEKAHLLRWDHLWKPLGFLILAIFWFDPLVWAAYHLLSRDIELACDEKVIKTLGKEEGIAYSEALLACSLCKRTVLVCPLAFGEVGVKERVRHVLTFKKPAFWIVAVAVAACLVLGVCFLTNPMGKPLPDFVIEEVDLNRELQEMQSMRARWNGDYFPCDEEDMERFQSILEEIRLRPDPISESTEEEKTASVSIELNGTLRLHFSADFSYMWIENGGRLSESYRIVNRDEAENLLLACSLAKKNNGEKER